MEERQDREPRRGPDDGDDRRGGRGGPRFKKKTCRFCEVKDMADRKSVV